MPIFHIFYPKHRLWVRNVSTSCVNQQDTFTPTVLGGVGFVLTGIKKKTAMTGTVRTDSWIHLGVKGAALLGEWTLDTCFPDPNSSLK